MIDPRNIPLLDWANQTVLLLSTIGQMPVLSEPARWKEWASAVIQVPGIGTYSPPLPNAFEDWETWAERFVQAVPL